MPCGQQPCRLPGRLRAKPASGSRLNAGCRLWSASSEPATSAVCAPSSRASVGCRSPFQIRGGAWGSRRPGPGLGSQVRATLPSSAPSLLAPPLWNKPCVGVFCLLCCPWLCRLPGHQGATLPSGVTARDPAAEGSECPPCEPLGPTRGSPAPLSPLCLAGGCDPCLRRPGDCPRHCAPQARSARPQHPARLLGRETRISTQTRDQKAGGGGGVTSVFILRLGKPEKVHTAGWFISGAHRESLLNLPNKMNF